MLISAALAVVAFVPADAWYDDFKPLSDVDARIEQIAADHDAATMFEVGTSVEGRSIRGLRITTGAPDSELATVLVVGTQHGREWLAPMVTTCIAEHLAAGDGAPDLLDRIQFVVVPVVNPDGYDYTWTTDRFWRKNRAAGGGVDLNRNWAAMWGLGAAGQGSETYPGTSAFSEPETAAIATLADGEDVVVMIDIHAPINAVLLPFAFTSKPGPREDEQIEWGEAIASAITNVNGLHHDVIKPGAGMPTGGLAQDWFATAHDGLAFTLEVRGGGPSGFDPPASEIQPTCAENWAGFQELAERASADYGVDPPAGGTGTDTGDPGDGTATADDGPSETSSAGLTSSTNGSGPSGDTANEPGTEAESGSAGSANPSSADADGADSDGSSGGCAVGDGQRQRPGLFRFMLVLLAGGRLRYRSRPQSRVSAHKN